MKYNLSAQNIDLICNEIRTYTKKNKVNNREIIRLALSCEEVLLNYREKFGEDQEVSFSINRRFSSVRIRMLFHCKNYNPFEPESDQTIFNSLLASQNRMQHSWKYNGANLVSFSVPITFDISNLFKIICALIIGGALGFASKRFFSPSVYESVVSDFINPITKAYTGVLCVSAVLMVFFSMPLSIVESESVLDFQLSAKRTFLSFLFIPLAIIAVFICVSFLWISYSGVDMTIFGTVKALFNVFISFFPTNLISPFANFDCAQVMIIGAIFGFAFLAMGERNRSVVSAFDTINYVAVLGNNFFAKYVFIYVGLTSYTLVNNKNISSYSFLFLLTIVACAVLFFAFSFYLCFKLDVKPTVLWKKLMPAFLINLSSASVGASFVDLFNEVKDDCGVDVSYCSMNINLGTVFFKPGYTAFLIAAAFFAQINQMQTASFVWLIGVVMLSILLPISIPNIPNGASSIILLMFSHLGFESHYSSQMAQAVISVNAIVQFIIVPINIFCLQCLTILQAEKENRINLDILRRPKK